MFVCVCVCVCVRACVRDIIVVIMALIVSVDSYVFASGVIMTLITYCRSSVVVVRLVQCFSIRKRNALRVQKSERFFMTLFSRTVRLESVWGP